MKNTFKKTLVAYCIISTISLSFLVPNNTSAQLAVSDFPVEVNTATIAGNTTVTAVNSTAETVKEHVLDGIVSMLVKAIIHRMIASTINWVNSGFQGAPAFIVDPVSFYEDIADGVAGQKIFNNPNWSFMCSPFKAKVQIAIRNAYAQPYGQFRCTLTGIARNFNNFMNDFNQGGWDSFIQITQNSENNPIGLYVKFQSQLDNEIKNKTEKQKEELSWGKGFLSFKKCTDGQVVGTQGGKDIINCKKYETQTPGTVIENQLNGVIGTDYQGLIQADEINELIGALLGQVTGRIVGGIGGGLRSLGGGGSSGGSYTDTLVASSTNIDQQATQLGNQANTGGTGGNSNTVNTNTGGSNTGTNQPNITTCNLQGSGNISGTVGGSIDGGVTCYPICPTSTNSNGFIVNGVCTDVNTLSTSTSSQNP